MTRFGPARYPVRYRAPADAIGRPAMGAIPVPAWRVTVILVTLLAFWWQSQLTQTHLHSHSASHSAVAYSAEPTQAKQLAVGLASSDSQPDCPICREMAQTGHYLLPLPLAFRASCVAAPWLDAGPVLTSTYSRRSHAWQSRAPPDQLQT